MVERLTLSEITKLFIKLNTVLIAIPGVIAILGALPFIILSVVVMDHIIVRTARAPAVKLRTYH